MPGHPHRMWKVYFPQFCLTSPSGICLGWMCIKRQLICVLGIAHAPIKDISNHLSNLSDSETSKVEAVGLWLNDGSDSKMGEATTKDTLRGRTFELILSQHSYDDIPECQLYAINEGTRSTQQSALFILYDENQLTDSKLDQWRTHSSESYKQSNHCIKSGVREEKQQATDIEEVFNAVQRSFPSLSKLKAKGRLNLSCDILSEKGKSWTRVAGNQLWQLFCFQLRVLFAVLHFLFDNRVFQNRVVHWLVRFPATGCQLVERFHTLQMLLDAEDLKSSAESEAECKPKRDESVQQKHQMNQRRGNIVCSIAVDICLGVLLMLWLQHNNLPVRMANWIIMWTNTTGEMLQQLLQWLMGNPAGLKLNSALAHFLGHFFLYHVYLWIGYLTVIAPFLSMLIWCMALSGCLGLSVLLAVASDMLSILTFHIYCFYVYAAKIYNMQMSGLLSLSRLFRGKKWNVLRHRVDSCSYDIDQLFIGTLLFTMLLFLLPTTALFYTVFTLLRLVVLIIQSLLTKLVHLLNTLPVYTLGLWVVKSDTLTDGVEFHVKTQLNGRPPYLIMQVQLMSLSRVVQIGQESFRENTSKILETPKTLVDLGKSLIRGHLIYPWGGENREKSVKGH